MSQSNAPALRPGEYPWRVPSENRKGGSCVPWSKADRTDRNTAGGRDGLGKASPGGREERPMQMWSEVQRKQSKTSALRASLRRERQQQSQALFREPVWLSRKRFCLPGHYRVDTRRVETNVARIAVIQAPPLKLFCKEHITSSWE